MALQPDLRDPRALTRGDLRGREVLDCRVEQTIEIELGTEMQEHPAEPDRGAIHEHELARHSDWALLAQRLMHAERFAPAIFGRLDPIRYGARAVVEQRAVDEPCPDIERFDQVAVETAKTPGLVGVQDQGIVVLEQPMIEIDHAADEPGRENPNATVVEEVDSPRFAVVDKRRVVTEVRI